MPIQIYNSLTRQKEELVPRDGKTIKMYVCGVTVYDQCHIGHARSLYIFDVIRRFLSRFSGYQVRFVRNITDVDDKIINKGRAKNRAFGDVVEENVRAYRRDLENLGIAQADSEPRATQYIPQMVDFIVNLMDKGYAYEVEGDVYYDVRRFKNYGKLSGQSVDQMVEATRIEQDPHKRDPLDFALWKKAKEDEPSWPSPWGPGRPGWHIECSCMSMQELDTATLDIHAGGRDLIFPHHENEIAQSEALTGKPFVRYWLHHGLLTINSQKMAKSLGNFITLDEVLARYPADILKLFYLQSHYRSPVDFSWKKMDEVKKAYDRLHILWDKLALAEAPLDLPATGWLIGHREAFRSAMDDDFNTPKALSIVFDLVNECNKLFELTVRDKDAMLEETKVFLDEIFDLFGIRFHAQENLSADERQLLQDRVQARRDKNFQRSDEIREALHARGIIVEDTKDGQVWRRA